MPLHAHALFFAAATLAARRLGGPGSDTSGVGELGRARRLEDTFSTTVSPPQYDAAELAGRIIGAFALLCLSALFSGLTLGLMGLDTNELEIVRESGEAQERRYAAAILPVRRRGNLLLCTLVTGNVAVISLQSILLADLTSGLVGFLLSTVLTVVFGEQVPIPPTPYPSAAHR